MMDDKPEYSFIRKIAFYYTSMLFFLLLSLSRRKRNNIKTINDVINYQAILS